MSRWGLVQVKHTAPNPINRPTLCLWSMGNCPPSPKCGLLCKNKGSSLKWSLCTVSHPGIHDHMHVSSQLSDKTISTDYSVSTMPRIFNLHSNHYTSRQVLLVSCYRWGQWSSSTLRNLPNVTQGIKWQSQKPTQTHVVAEQHTLSCTKVPKTSLP